MADKEYIERGAVINLLHYHTDEACSAVVADFEAIPTADVVEVVRCKDCMYLEWWESNNGHYLYHCENPAICLQHPYPDGFCSYGERKNNDSRTEN